VSPPALNWVNGLGARFDKRGRQVSPGHLYGAARAALWAAANRADSSGCFWMGSRRWAEDAGLRDRKHLAVVVEWLVWHKVLEVTRPAAGPHEAHYRFTFRAPEGLPARLPSTPPPSGGEVVGIDQVAWRDALATGGVTPPLDGAATGGATPPQDPASGGVTPPVELVEGSAPASGGEMASLWRGDPAKTNEPKEPPPTGGAVLGGESNERGGPAGKPAAAQTGNHKPIQSPLLAQVTDPPPPPLPAPARSAAR
jgi:hypothetical protein